MRWEALDDAVAGDGRRGCPDDGNKTVSSWESCRVRRFCRPARLKGSAAAVWWPEMTGRKMGQWLEVMQFDQTQDAKDYGEVEESIVGGRGRECIIYRGRSPVLWL
jgi:hypothetical protein